MIHPKVLRPRKTFYEVYFLHILYLLVESTYENIWGRVRSVNEMVCERSYGSMEYLHDKNYICFFQICLDEAQMVESTITNVR